MLAGLLIIPVAPFVAVGLTAWSTRASPVVSRASVGIAAAVLLVGVGGWWWGSQDEKQINLVPMGLVAVPAAQVLVWSVGYSLVWRHRVRAEPFAAPDTGRT